MTPKGEMKMKKVRLYIFIAYVWSFICWGIAIIIAETSGETLYQNAQLWDVLLTGHVSARMFLAAILSIFGTYGPMVGVFVTLFIYKDLREDIRPYFTKGFTLNLLIYVLVFFMLLTGLPSIVVLLINGVIPTSFSNLALFIPSFFVFQLLSSGLEEIGWRGYLLPVCLKTMTPWKASVRVGFIWALWHLPIVLYIFYTQGLQLPQMISSYIGFTAGIVAMSTIHTFFFLKSKSVYLSILIHTIGNTTPMLFGLLTGESYIIAVAVQVLLWLYVIYLTKKHKVLFDEIQE